MIRVRFFHEDRIQIRFFLGGRIRIRNPTYNDENIENRLLQHKVNNIESFFGVLSIILGKQI